MGQYHYLLWNALKPDQPSTRLHMLGWIGSSTVLETKCHTKRKSIYLILCPERWSMTCWFRMLWDKDLAGKTSSPDHISMLCGETNFNSVLFQRYVNNSVFIIMTMQTWKFINSTVCSANVILVWNLQMKDLKLLEIKRLKRSWVKSTSNTWHWLRKYFLLIIGWVLTLCSCIKIYKRQKKCVWN